MDDEDHANKHEGNEGHANKHGRSRATKAMRTSTTGKMKKRPIYSEVAQRINMKPASVKAAIEGILTLAAAECKKHGSFKVAGMLKLSLKKKKLNVGMLKKLKDKCCR